MCVQGQMIHMSVGNHQKQTVPQVKKLVAKLQKMGNRRNNNSKSGHGRKGRNGSRGCGPYPTSHPIFSPPFGLADVEVSSLSYHLQHSWPGDHGCVQLILSFTTLVAWRHRRPRMCPAYPIIYTIRGLAELAAVDVSSLSYHLQHLRPGGRGCVQLVHP